MISFIFYVIDTLDSFNFEDVWHHRKSFFFFSFFREIPLENLNLVCVLTSLWSFFGTLKDFENSSIGIFFFDHYSLGILDYIRIV